MFAAKKDTVEPLYTVNTVLLCIRRLDTVIINI